MSEELKQFNINIEDIREDNNLFDNIQEAISELNKYTLINRYEVILNNNLIKCKDKLTNYRTIFGCRISYDNLDNNISFIVKEDIKPTYEELEHRIENCKKYLKAIENHDFNADISINILNGDNETIKKYLTESKKIYDEEKLKYTDEMKFLIGILGDKEDE